MNDETFSELLEKKETIIVLDTNVILDLARYSLYTSKNILQIFSKCKDLLWIPNQVDKEYKQNKHKVFGDLRKRFSNFERNLLQIIDENEKSLKKILNSSYRYKYFGNKTLSEDISKKTEEFRRIIKSYKQIVGTEYDEITSDSPKIISDIETFFSDLEKGKKIGFKERLEIIKEGELRYKYKLPPGFEDDKKDGIEKFGDLFVWKEILKLPSQKDITDIIFVTNDDKDDWWSKEQSGKAVIREELLDEFKENNPSVLINFMTVSMFQKYASKLYGLYEFEVYVDLNRNDHAYLERVSERLSDDITERILDNPSDYLFSGELGSEEIEDVEIANCSMKTINDVNLELIDGDVSIFYEIEFEVELYCNSYEYWGRDEDTKDVIMSPGTEHIFEGSVVVSIVRTIKKEVIELDPNYIQKDIIYEELDIIENELEQVSVNSYDEMYYDEEVIFKDGYKLENPFLCTICGDTFDYRYDRGGICFDCSVK